MDLRDYEKWPATSKSVYESIEIRIPFKPSSILITGMGGSGIVGDVVRDYLGNRLPIHVVKDTIVPDWINDKTLTIAISYSGNTAETMCSALLAHGKGSHVVGITAGGRMLKEFNERGISVITIPSATAPRFGFPQLLYAALAVINKAIGINEEDIEESIAAQEEALRDKLIAADIGNQLIGRVPYIFVDSRVQGVAIRFKNDLNENAKTPAIVAAIPEANHNDIVTLMMNHPVKHILIRAGPNPIIDAVETVFNDFLSKLIKIDLKGNGILAKELYGISLLGVTTLYMAETLGVDPVRTDPIDALKKRMGRLC